MYYYSVISLSKLYIYSIFVFNFHIIENTSLVYLILNNIHLKIYIIDVIYVYIYHNLVTEMQAAVAIISISRSIYNKLSFHCHDIYISKIKVFVFTLPIADTAETANNNIFISHLLHIHLNSTFHTYVNHPYKTLKMLH